MNTYSAESTYLYELGMLSRRAEEPSHLEIEPHTQSSHTRTQLPNPPTIHQYQETHARTRQNQSPTKPHPLKVQAGALQTFPNGKKHGRILFLSLSSSLSPTYMRTCISRRRRTDGVGLGAAGVPPGAFSSPTNRVQDDGRGLGLPVCTRLLLHSCGWRLRR
jgi:hypothetical protein